MIGRFLAYEHSIVAVQLYLNLETLRNLPCSRHPTSEFQRHNLTLQQFCSIKQHVLYFPLPLVWRGKTQQESHKHVLT